MDNPDSKKRTYKKKTKKKEDSLFDWLKKSIDLLVHNSLSQTVILSSYKLNAVLKNNYGINIKVDRIGRALSKYAKQNNLKRLSTKIPKYQLSVDEYHKLKKDQQEKEPKEQKT